MRNVVVFAVVALAISACTDRKTTPPSVELGLSQATPSTVDSAKYARCAGSYEMQKCRAMVDAADAETPEAKQARVEKMERERLAAAQAVVSSPTANAPSPQQQIAYKPKIGMNEYEAAVTSWGPPLEKNRTETQYGTREQWVFGDGHYLYLENGRVTSISSRH